MKFTGEYQRKIPGIVKSAILGICPGDDTFSLVISLIDEKEEQFSLSDLPIRVDVGETVALYVDAPSKGYNTRILCIEILTEEGQQKFMAALNMTKLKLT